MNKVDATHDFSADGVAYRMDVYQLSEDPLVFRHEFLRRESDTAEWVHVAYDDRQYDPPAGVADPHAEMVALLRGEGPLMAREFLTYISKKAARKKSPAKSRKKV